ncbi:MAG: L-seryl-tRNA(Sec) selenium transferase [Isosphaeraceae bacterium]
MNAPNPRDLPGVLVVLQRPELDEVRGRHGRDTMVDAVRRAIDDARSKILRGERVSTDPSDLARAAARRLGDDRAGLRPVLNATGILLHTGLGRAPLAQEAVEAVAEVARGYCNLEVDLTTGERGHRATAVAPLLCRLTGCEAAAVVNNNAGATVLALRALALGREVVVSRGQLIEIGGSFRLPEIFEVSGARLREVGTTNRTRLSDYERAIGPETAVLLRVHPSNYRVVGFTESVGIAELVRLGKSRGLATVDDIGSGVMGSGLPLDNPFEPTAREGIEAGADLVLASGDKLLGGPQCGLLLGTKAAVSRVSADPLMRALRVDKMTLAALEATLRLALDPERGRRRIPVWSFLNAPREEIRSRAEAIAQALRDDPGLEALAVDTKAYLGGGSLPAEPLPSAAVRISPATVGLCRSVSDWAKALRLGRPAVFARIQDGALLFDCRSLDPGEDARLIEAVRRLARDHS